MDLVSHLALFLWFPIVLVLFQRLPPHRALIAAFVAGTLFLPEILQFKHMPEAPEPMVLVILKATKINVISSSALLASFVFDFSRWLSFRPRWFDIPMLMWCAVPFISDYTNDVALYECIVASRDQTLAWGLPYFLGRLYLGSAERIRDVALGLVLGGLAYVPFCLFEIVKGQEMHYRVYGFHQNDPTQSIRGLGNRPVVFLEHGLAVGLWMVVATMMAVWLWQTKALTKIDWWPGKYSLPVKRAAMILLVVTALINSTGAMALGVLGIIAMYQTRWIGWPILLVGLLLISPLYVGGRIATGQEPVGWMTAKFDNEKIEKELEKKAMAKPLFGWGVTGQQFIGGLTLLFGAERTASLQFRLKYEDLFMEKALLKPLFGWGDTGEARKFPGVKKQDDEPISDGLWIIALGSYGIVGLASVWAAILLPAVRFMLRHPPRLWVQPIFAPAAVVSLILIMFMIDNLLNAIFNPVYVLMAGGLAGWSGAGVANVSTPALPPRRKSLSTEHIQTPLQADTQMPRPQITEAPPGILSRRPPSSR